MKKIRLGSITAPIRGKLNLAITLSCISVVGHVAALVDMLFLGNGLMRGELSLRSGLGLLSLLLSLILISVYTKLKAADVSHFASYDLEAILRNRITQQISRLPLGEVYRLGQGTLVKVLQDDVKGLHAYVADAPPLLARAIIAPLLIFPVLLFFSWKWMLLPILFVALILLSVKLSSRGTEKQMADQIRSTERVSASIIEFIQAMPVIKLFDSGSSSFKLYKDALRRHRDLMLGWYRKVGPIYRLIVVLSTPIPTILIVSWFGFYLQHSKQLDFLGWFSVLLIGVSLIESISPYMFLQYALRKARWSIERIQEIEAIPTLPISPNPREPRGYDIVFEQVTFTYEAVKEPVLKQISFELKENTFTAIVGTSGSGKSTLVRLIPRFWDTTLGQVKIGGVPVKEIHPDRLMGYISFIFQDNFLFNDTVANNIAYGLEGLSQAEIIEAAKKAQAHEFIMQLPNGYDSFVGERGQSLSGGQRQRITIARAFLQDRPILILDEATAYADPENEALLLKAIDQLMYRKTVIMIAHRLSNISHADQIVVLHQGEMVEYGTHASLLAQQQYYYRLWTAYQQAQAWQL